jgi:hypothetical protein
MQKSSLHFNLKTNVQPAFYIVTAYFYVKIIEIIIIETLS